VSFFFPQLGGERFHTLRWSYRSLRPAGTTTHASRIQKLDILTPFLLIVLIHLIQQSPNRNRKMSGRGRGRGRGAGDAPRGGGGGGRGAPRGGAPDAPRGGGGGRGGGRGGAVVRGAGPAITAGPAARGRGGGLLPAAHVQTVAVRRKAFGTLGQAIEVWTNHFAVDIPQEIIHHYDGWSSHAYFASFVVLTDVPFSYFVVGKSLSSVSNYKMHDH
jgi:hypothetical protein